MTDKKLRKFDGWEWNGNNYLMRRDNFEVSYNPNTNFGITSFFGDNSCPHHTGKETALIIDDRYYILDGDFRSDYEKITNIDKAMEFFNSKPEVRCAWTTKP